MNKLTQDAIKAADLIKRTSETTATALNISYIQKDIVEIKDSLKSLAINQDTKIDRLEDKFDILSTIVYTGVGISIAVSVLLKFFIK